MREITIGGPCRVCRSDLRSTVLDLGLRPDLDDFPATTDILVPEVRVPLRLWLCHVCGLVQLGRETPPTRRSHGHGSLFSTTTASADERWVADLRAAGRIGPGQRVLDIAAGTGRRLRAAQLAGALVAGFEADPVFAGSVDQGQLGVQPTQFEEDAARALSPSGRFDLILVSHMLAHEDDPTGLIAAVERLMAPAGAIAIEFQHLLEVVRTGQFDIVSGAHRSYLSLQALAHLLGQFDLVITSSTQIGLHGGVVRVIAQRRSSAVRDAATDRLFDEERVAGLDHPQVYLELGQRASATACALGEYLREQREAGRRVIGYGAPSRGALLLDLAGATSADLAFTVDRAPDKQGRLLPGSRVPVKSPDRLVAADPDEVLILAWTLRDEVIQQLRPLVRRQPRYTVAMPRLEVVA